MKHSTNGRRSAAAQHSSGTTPQSRSGSVWQVLGIVAEILFTLAVVCALYIVWQMWWTGVEAERTQEQTRQAVSWSDPSKSETVQIAAAQDGEPPVQSGTFESGDLMAQIYIPRFGNQWVRNIVQGTDLVELNKHGLGHYPQTQMPGQIGNFAAAGHRNGYGQPLGDVDKLQPGDNIIVRTKDYWYVYKYTGYKIVLPTEVQVIDANPEHPGQTATQRLITLTTCEPKYSTPTHRWISSGELVYWAKVSDGIPKELSSTDASGAVKFVNNETTSVVAKLSSLVPVILVALALYLALFIAGAIAWRWPVLRAIREGKRKRPDMSLYGAFMRHQPGILPIRIVLGLLAFVIVAACLFQWVFPWAAGTIPFLQQMSNYVAV